MGIIHFFKKEKKVLVVFFDQFENMLFKQDVLNVLNNIFLKIRSEELNVIFVLIYISYLL